MDSDGIDVYFLNRNPMLNVTNAQTIRQAFNSPPQGGYPGGQQTGGFGGPGMGPNTGGIMSNDQRAQRLNQVIQQYEINQQYASRLQALGTCEIVILCDDSGSMNTPLQGSNQTRWDELKSVCN